MRVKIFKRSAIHRNLILYLVGSYFFIFMLQSLNSGVGSLDEERVWLFLDNYKFFSIYFLFALIALYKATRNSFYYLMGYIGLILIEGIGIYFTIFDKIVLIYLFGFFLLSALYLVLWFVELQDVVYRPVYSRHSIGRKSVCQFSIFVKDCEGQELEASVTNWSRQGFFVLFSPETVSRLPRRKLYFRLAYRGVDFQGTGEVVSNYGHGYGVRVVANHPEYPKVASWSEFIDIIDDRGYVAEYREIFS